MSFSEDDHGNMIYKFESSQHILCDECGEDITVCYGACYWNINKKPILINKKLGIWCLADFLNIPNNYFSFGVYRAKNPYNPDLYYHYIMLTNEDYKNMPIFITEAEANEVLNGPQQGRDILAFIEGFFKKEQD
jgi:hypothetical protein